MKSHNYLFIVYIILILLLSSCTLPNSQANETDDLIATITAQALTNSASPAEPTTPPLPTAAPTATTEPTPTIPIVSVSSYTNCRTGPGVVYDKNGDLDIGETAEVVGKNSATGYWIINNKDAAGTCWLWGNYASVLGNTASLQEYSIPPAPPTPLPALSKPDAPKNLKANVTCVLSAGPFSPYDVEVKLTWTDVANNEDGYRILKNGSLLVTLAADSTSYTDNTSLASVIVFPNPTPSHTYEVQAYNSDGKSTKIDVKVDCP